MRYRKTFAVMCAMGLLASTSAAAQVQADQPKPLPGLRPSAATIASWRAHKFGMFIHFGLYSLAGGEWQGQQIDNGYSEQIMANAPVAKPEYERLADRFDPTKFDPDAIVALAKAAGMKFIVLTAKHHDGFALFRTKASRYNSVDGTPYGRDIVGALAEACRRQGLAFGVYYSTIDWHQPAGNTYIEGNSNPITPAQAAFNVVQLKELATNYGPLSEIWFDMGKPTPAQSALFASTVHAAQPELMVSGRVWNHEGDFTVMGDNALPRSEMEEPWQAPASIFSDTWGYRSWEKRGDLAGKIAEHIDRLARVTSAGGNYILNIGPEGDGSIVPYEAEVLRGIGAWMRTNGEAIYDAGRQPFGQLDFGYASTKPDTLYLMVRTLPADGRLRLPGVVGSPFGSAKVLGHADVPVSVETGPDGSWVDASALSSLHGEAMPVIAIKLSKPLVVRPQALVPLKPDGARLLAGSAARFQNYNGFGYEDPARLYKLRWDVALAPGRYAATVRFVAPITHSGVIDLVVDGVPHRLDLQPGMDRATTTVARDPYAYPFAMRVEVTPKQPFTKADALPQEIREVGLDRFGQP